MTSSARLQHEADSARAGLSAALDELRGSVTTTALTNGAMTFAKEGSSAVARAAVDRAMASPLAALLIGAGIVLLMSGGKGSSDGGVIEKGNSAVRDAASKLGSVGSAIASTAASALTTTKQASGSVLNMAKDAAGQVTSTASQAAHLATDSYGKAKDLLAQARSRAARRSPTRRKLVATPRAGSSSSPGSSRSGRGFGRRLQGRRFGRQPAAHRGRTALHGQASKEGGRQGRPRWPNRSPIR
jgi:hypothetical protein